MTTSETKANIAQGMATTAIEFATRETDAEVNLKTLTCDFVTMADGPLVFEAEMVRKTRSLVFLNLNAIIGGVPVATGTAILSISNQL